MADNFSKTFHVLEKFSKSNETDAMIMNVHPWKNRPKMFASKESFISQEPNELNFYDTSVKNVIKGTSAEKFPQRHGRSPPK